jgi:hypothetical protein
VACDSDQIVSAECSYYYFAAATTDVITSTIQLSCMYAHTLIICLSSVEFCSIEQIAPSLDRCFKGKH